MTTAVPQAAVDAAMKALDCKRVGSYVLGHWCEVHQFGWLSDVNACVRSEHVAAAVVAAVQGPIKAEARHELISAVYHSGRDLVHIDTLQEFSDQLGATA